MKVCHIITRLIVGGAQENTLLTCEGLHRRGHDVTLMVGPETGAEGSLWDEARSGGYRVMKIDSLRRSVNPWHDARCLGHLRAALRDLKCDVVHTHSSKAGILGRRAAANANVPVVVHTIHGMSFNRTQPWWRQRVYRFVERRAACHTHGFISVADAMTDQAVAARLAPRARFVTIRSGMRLEHYAPNPAVRAEVRRAWNLTDGDVAVGTVARLFRNKGYEHILDALPIAAERNPRLRFIWIGEGAQRDEYLQKLSDMGLTDRVHLTGLVPPSQIGRLMNGLDILVHASLWEGLPRALVQAMLTGVPVVSFDNDGAPEVVLPGSTGVLVSRGDAVGLADGLVSLAADGELRRRLGAEGRRRCLEMFDHGMMVDQIEALYARLIVRTGRTGPIRWSPR